MGRVSREARLCFILLWTVVDDAGRTRANEVLLANLLYPYDLDARKAITRWLDELEAERCVVRYQVGGNSYLQVLKWGEHQRIDHPTASKLPSPSEADGKAREDSRECQEGLEGKGLEGTGKDQSAKAEIAWRIEQTWTAHLTQWHGFYLDENGAAPAVVPTLTQEIKDAIRASLLEHDAALLGADQREEWAAKSKTRAAGIGMYLDPFLAGQHKDNDRRNGGKRYLEHWRPWKRQKGKGDPVDRFAELYFEVKSVRA